MRLSVNRRVREKAMVLGLPAERFMAALGLMCLPLFGVIFYPLAVVVWIPWCVGVYYIARNRDRLLRSFKYGKQFPENLKNR